MAFDVSKRDRGRKTILCHQNSSCIFWLLYYCAQANLVFLAASEKPSSMLCVWQRGHSSTYWNSRADRELLSQNTLLNSMERGRDALCGILLTESKDISCHFALLKFHRKAVSPSSALSQKQNNSVCG